MPSEALSQPASAAIEKIESIISKDEGGRGMESLVVRGDLRRAAELLARLKPLRASSAGPAHILILSGFPCCVNESPPTETDGPPGSFAIARAVVGLGHKATIVTDECNHEVFRAAKKDVGVWAEGSLELEIFPSEDRMDSSDYEKMSHLVNVADLIVACERAGPAEDGHCYTMRGIDMNSKGLIAPLHKIVEMGRKEKIDGKVDSSVRFVAIGDGGNEMGMGKVLDTIRTNPKIKNGSKIAAVTPADYLIAASVSNWGGYALAASAAVVRADDTFRSQDSSVCYKEMLKRWIEACVPQKEDEISLLNRCVQAGCRDGVSGKLEATVDGMPLEKSLECLQHIRVAALDGNNA
eukprot:CAMPEP_0197453448 /NCGR_PEP_ID=MMETSP1175-20131217/34955_1 /TAXON_ID=1003142 /ORGANISM="Triceratium dubium, Strain CCMP147" /LENGTH=351 /DNA_ID=CAMNT_0042986733 /DNA_START=66 /DNA_END=1121 /DNA_ORIENTATION=+